MLLFIHVLAKCWSRCELITKKNSRDKDWVQPDMKKSINWIETNKEAGVLRYVMHFRATLNHRYTLSIGLDLKQPQTCGQWFTFRLTFACQHNA